MRQRTSAIAFLAALVIAAGCGIGEALQDPGDPVDMTTANIAGTWHAGTQRFITFHEDGTFTALNLPLDLFDDSMDEPDPAAPQIDASGRYTLGLQSLTTAGPHSKVTLTIEEHTRADLSVGEAELSALRPGDGQVYLVFFYAGRQGNMTTGYLRCDTDCLPPAPVGSAGLGPAPHAS